MKNTLKKSLALGLGIAASTKEQAEKIVKELVEKGELSKEESKELVNELVKKGEETQKEIDARVDRKLKKVIRELNLVTKDELEELKQRIEALENK